MLIQAGSIEMLLSDSVDAAAKARNQGVKVRLSVYEGMFHVFQMGYLNFPESKRAWAEVKRFLKVIKEEEQAKENCVEKVILFGSRARGDYKERSCLDTVDLCT